MPESNTGFPERDSQHSYENEDAIKFLVTRILESGHNPKPVIFHSIHMGIHLYELGYGPDITRAAILHDIIEDSDTELPEISKLFGENVARIVQANTFDNTVGDRAAQGKDSLKRCLYAGWEALIVKAADKLQNSAFMYPESYPEFFRFWVNETRELADASQPVIGKEPIWKELNEQCRKLETALKKLENE